MSEKCPNCDHDLEEVRYQKIARALQHELGRTVASDLDSILTAVGSLGNQRIAAVSREEALRWVLNVQARGAENS